MNVPDFDEIQTEIQTLYQESKWADALTLATKYAGQFPERAHLFYYWRICLAARQSHLDQSLSLLAEALEKGIWYGEVLLRKSPSLQELQGLIAYESLIERNNRLQELEQENLYPLLILRPDQECNGEEHECPLLIGLHANASTALASVNFWKAAASLGWLVAIPQSSQAMWQGSYIWDDLDISRREIENHFDSIARRYSINRDKVVLAGHSMGGELAIWLALMGAIPIQGFLALGPAGPKLENPEQWLQAIQTARSRAQERGDSLRGYFIVVENDHTIPHQEIRELVEMLVQAGFDCQIETLSGIGHEYSPDYEEALLRGLDFIENQ